MKITLVAAFLIGILASPAAKPPKPKTGCDTERWAVKTLRDPGGKSAAVSEEELVRTVTELNALPAPTSDQLRDATLADSRFPAETRVYSVRALLIGHKLEADGHYQIILADPNNPTITMIAEIPAGRCTKYHLKFNGMQRTFAELFGKPTEELHRLNKPFLVEVMGVGFFAPPHGQIGAARNGFEISPVLGYRILRED